MKFKSQLVFIALLTGIFFTSCSSKFSLQKRRYNKGFYFERTNSTHNQKNDNIIVKSKKAEPLNDKNNILNTNVETVVILANEDKGVDKANIQISPKPELEKPLIVHNKKKKANSSNQFLKNSFEKPLGFKKSENSYKTKVPFGMGDSGSVWGIVGAISAIISIFFLLIFLISIGAIFSGIGGTSAVLGPIIFIGIIVVVLIAIGVLFLINSD